MKTYKYNLRNGLVVHFTELPYLFQISLISVNGPNLE